MLLAEDPGQILVIEADDTCCADGSIIVTG